MVFSFFFFFLFLFSLFSFFFFLGYNFVSHQKKEINIFKDFFSNSIFVGILIFTLVMQFLLIQFGGEFVSTTPLNLNEWLFCIGVGALGLPVGFALRLIPVEEPPHVERVVPKVEPSSSSSQLAKDRWKKTISTVKRTNSIVSTLVSNAQKKKKNQEKWKEAINAVKYEASIVKYLRKDRLRRESQSKSKKKMHLTIY